VSVKSAITATSQESFFRGPAHESCSLNYKYIKFIPLYFHNLSGYDAHLFIKELAKLSDTNISIIPSNEENYISFSKDFVVDRFTRNGKVIEITRTVRFLDTFRFMRSALDKLVSNLETLPETHRYIPGADKRKNVYPYEYMDSFDK